MAWMSNYIQSFKWDIITYPWPNIDAALANLCEQKRAPVIMKSTTLLLIVCLLFVVSATKMRTSIGRYKLRLYQVLSDVIDEIVWCHVVQIYITIIIGL